VDSRVKPDYDKEWVIFSVPLALWKTSAITANILGILVLSCNNQRYDTKGNETLRYAQGDSAKLSF
jgi:hypothetical protein